MKSLSKKTLDGNVETIILSQLRHEPSYGYALVREINKKHGSLLKLGEGTIYPVLYRMEDKGLLRSELQDMPSGRQRKYYRITAKGKAALAENLQQWEALVNVMEKIRSDWDTGTSIEGEAI
jgi:PadR family transcriptional regulator, regulatory protein PadR